MFAAAYSLGKSCYNTIVNNVDKDTLVATGTGSVIGGAHGAAYSFLYGPGAIKAAITAQKIAQYGALIGTKIAAIESAFVVPAVMPTMITASAITGAVAGAAVIGSGYLLYKYGPSAVKAAYSYIKDKASAETSSSTTKPEEKIENATIEVDYRSDESTDIANDSDLDTLDDKSDLGDFVDSLVDVCDPKEEKDLQGLEIELDDFTHSQILQFVQSNK